MPALCGLGKLRARLDRPAEAEDLFRRALRLAPGDWRTLANYGVLMAAGVGDVDNGARLLRMAEERAPPGARGEVGRLREAVAAAGAGAAEAAKSKERRDWESRWENAEMSAAPYNTPPM